MSRRKFTYRGWYVRVFKDPFQSGWRANATASFHISCNMPTENECNVRVRDMIDHYIAFAGKKLYEPNWRQLQK